jgi:hypothetical protein
VATITILPAVRKKCLTSAASLSVLVHKAHEMSFAPHRSYAQSVRLYVDARMCPFTKSTTGRATVLTALIPIQGVALSEARRSRKSMTSLCFSSHTHVLPFVSFRVPVTETVCLKIGVQVYMITSLDIPQGIPRNGLRLHRLYIT